MAGFSRRELIQTLTAMAVAAGTSASAASLKAGSINHTSVLVSDMARSIDFYNRVFGLSVMNEDKANKISRLGTGGRYWFRCEWSRRLGSSITSRSGSRVSIARQ